MATKKTTMRKTKAQKKRRGRPPKIKTISTPEVNETTIHLPINTETDVEFWENLLRFASVQNGNAFYIRLDGMEFKLLSK